MSKTPIQIFTEYFRKLNSQIPLTFSLNDLHKFFTQIIKTISLDDFNFIFDDLTRDKNQFTQEQALQIYFVFQRQSKKVFSRVQPPIATFLFQSLIRVTQSSQNQHMNQLVLDGSKQLNQNRLNTNGSFSDILSQDYLKKLINMGANGLINQKQQEKIQKYYFNHWVQTNQTGLFSTQSKRLQVQLLKAVWMFDFVKAFQISERINELMDSDILSEQQKNEYSQIFSVMPGLQNLKQINIILIKHPQIKPLIQGRNKFQIQFKQQLLKKQGIMDPRQISTLNQHFNEVIQLFTFTQQYFEMIQNQLENPYFKQIAAFINSTIDDKQKSQQEVQDFSKMEQISIVQRFLYAKRYFSQENFQYFKQLIKQKSDNLTQIDYILIFGNKKQSELILQNYLDQTSEIQKVALISVYLKTFSEQAKAINSRAQHRSLYQKFIYVYQWLLDKVDGGISKHNFDKKCLTIQIQRKRKNLTKTFTFDCTNCKAQQIYSVLSKKINIDSRQPKLKGYHYFAKDNRSQIMYCIQCMIMLPKCSICLYPISVFNAYAEQMKKNLSQKKATNKGQPINKALVWCPKCKHGGHFDHIMQWFLEQKRKCPVSNCKCKCSI